MSRLKAGLLTIFAAVLVAVPLANAGTGLYAYDDVPMKYVWSEALKGGCTEEVINSGLSSGNGSRCVEPVGSWTSQDLVPIILGGFLLLGQLKSSMSGTAISVGGAGRKARLKMSIGVLLLTIFVVDILGRLSPSEGKVDWSSVTAIPLPNPFFYGALLALGLRLFFKGRSDAAIASEYGDVVDGVTSSEMRRQELLFRSTDTTSMPELLSSKGLSQYQTVGEMRQSMGLIEHESEFEKAMSDDMGMSVGRTCHYCNGAGCAQCDGSGEL